MDVIYPDLKDKIILVTGASRGIGRALAQSLAKQGSHVVFNYRGDKSQCEELTKELEALGGKATGLFFDVTDTNQAKQAIEEFTKNTGLISGLINNAGISKDMLVMRIKEEELSRILDTNLKATIMLTSILSRSFLKAENVSIINVSSVVGLMGNVGQAAYAASKAGVIGFTKSYAKELASRNIRCNAICPGFIATEMTQDLPEKTQEEYLSNIPLKRLGSTQEVAGVTNFLLSSASSYITGETIKIDGGLYI